jgi:hypothetical protein
MSGWDHLIMICPAIVVGGFLILITKEGIKCLLNLFKK